MPYSLQYATAAPTVHPSAMSYVTGDFGGEGNCRDTVTVAGIT